MAERVPKGASLHFFTDETGRFRTQAKTKANLRGIGIGVTAALVAVGSYFAFRYGIGMEGDDFEYVSERQVPEPIRSPDDPYVDVYGRPILYPLKPSGVSEYDTTMSGEGEPSKPPQNSPDALKLRKEDPVAYFRTYYGHLTRGQVAEVDEALYRRIARIERAEGIEIIPRIAPYGKDPLEFYRQNYSGLTRGKLAVADQKYYYYLRYHGLLGSIPLADPVYGGNPLQYYYDNYAGMTRGQLQKADSVLYQQLQRTGELSEVPVQLPGENDPYRLYKAQYDGLTAEELKSQNKTLYWQLRRWGLINLLLK